jgi:GT2 family glycosyltransferase
MTRRTRIDRNAGGNLAAVIVSVYDDVQALRCILRALRGQSEPKFQVIVSEDGQCPAMRRFVAGIRFDFPALIHLTQEDCGFRKTRALNRAVCAADAQRLIFIDGDCVPHRRFVENHLRYAEPKTICAGRRVQLGPRLSLWLRNRPARITILQARNYEVGLVSPLLQSLRGPSPRFILGCNFSCSKEDLLAINGFNEDYVQPGAGEDTDLEWRFQQAGIRLKSVRFVAPVYHLHHESSWTLSQENQQILASTKSRGEVYCGNGIVKKCGKEQPGVYSAPIWR